MTREDNPATIIAKRAAGEAASYLVLPGMLVGLGTGSTAAFFIEFLGKRCREEGLKIRCAASSIETYNHAKKLNIPMTDDHTIEELDMTIDGADEIDPKKNMIKGGGGALFREKILAKSCKEFVVLVDENKLVKELGAHPVPVEISPFAYKTTLFRIKEGGYQGVLRLNRDASIYVTDNGNYIFDIQFNTIKDPESEDRKLRSITGIIETGLFYNVAKRVVVGYQDGFAKIES